MKDFKLFKGIAFTLCVLVLFSCVDISKRKHRGGFHVEWRTSSKNLHVSAKKNKNNQKAKNLSEVKNSNTSIIQLNLPQEKFKEEEVFLLNSFDAKTIENIEYVEPAQNSQSPIKNNSIDGIKLKNIDSGMNLSIGILLGGLSLFFFNKKKITKRSKWASQNKEKSRSIIAALSVAIPVLGLTAGWLNGNAEMTNTKLALFGGVGLISVTSHFFSKNKKSNFRFKGFLLLMAVLGMSFTLGGRIHIKSLNSVKHKVELSAKDSLTNSNAYTAPSNVDDEVPFEVMIAKFFGTVALCVLGLIGAFIFANISCALSCSGYGLLSAITLLLGVAGTAIITGLLITWLWRTSARRKQEKFIKKKIMEERIFAIVLGILFSLSIALGIFFNSPLYS